MEEGGVNNSGENEDTMEGAGIHNAENTMEEGRVNNSGENEESMEEAGIMVQKVYFKWLPSLHLKAI
ncbi:hypothetical protein TNCT_593881 [Trichonephila clavata]|uniref:Uncharacterized protein n=1 Tax=Trichonephila clavata TaxID=2740835 RepID=A0A8X6F780_TRICU|nr:hypothetical protein TNCT_593881 [Trichonephila clavata]